MLAMYIDPVSVGCTISDTYSTIHVVVITTNKWQLLCCTLSMIKTVCTIASLSLQNERFLVPLSVGEHITEQVMTIMISNYKTSVYRSCKLKRAFK